MIIFLSALNTALRVPPNIDTVQRRALFSGIVAGEENYSKFDRLNVGLDNMETNGKSVPCNVTVAIIAPGKRVYQGARLFINGYMYAQPYSLGPYVLTGTILRIERSHIFLWTLVHQVRSYIERTMNQLCIPEHRDLAIGLVMGGSGRLEPALKDTFSRAGILHILAVSGLHVGFVCLFGYAILSLLFLPRYIKFLIVMLMVVFYVFVTSFRPSVCRAAFMAGLFGTALLLERNVDRLHITNIAVLIMLSIDPRLLFSLSAQLSFAAVYGIVYLYPKIQQYVATGIKWKPLRLLCTPLAVSFSAQIFVSPLIAHYFHRLSLIAPLSNLFIVPLASMIVFILYTGLLVNTFWSTGASVIAVILKPLFELLLLVARTSAWIPFSVLHVSVPLSILLCLWGLIARVTRRYTLLILGILLLITGCAMLSPRLIIQIFPDTVVINLPDRKNLLIASHRLSSSDLELFLGPRSASVHYAVIPQMKSPIADTWIQYPAPCTALHMQFKDISIHLDASLNVQHGKKNYPVSDIKAKMFDNQKVYYIISNGERCICFQGQVHGSLLDDLVTELRVFFAQCFLLV